MSPTRPPSLMPPAPNSVAARAKVAADAVETLAEAGSQQANPSPRHSPKPPRTQETTADANARKAAAKAADIESAKEIVWSVLSLKMCDVSVPQDSNRASFAPLGNLLTVVRSTPVPRSRRNRGSSASTRTAMAQVRSPGDRTLLLRLSPPASA